MAFNYSPKVVTDGLVLYLDAANTKSYVSGSTTWNDISRSGTNGTLVNGPTFNSGNGGSIVFDGVNDYINQNLNTGLFSTEATLTIFLKLVNATPTVTTQTGIERLSANPTIQASHYPWVDGFAYLSTFLSGNTRYGPITLSNTIDRTNWHMITITSSPGSNNWRFYQNTQLITSNTGPNTISFSSDGVYNICRSQSNVAGTFFYCRGNIAQVQLYNRALNATEILQNYNATKGRYGL